MKINQTQVKGDYEYQIEKQLFWKPKYHYKDMLISDIDYGENGKYGALAYDLEYEEELHLKFYIPQHNPEIEPDNWDKFWKENPEPETIEEWFTYLI